MTGCFLWWEMFYERFNWCLFFNFTGQAMLAIAHSRAFKPNHRNLKTTSLPSDSSTRKMSSQRCCNLHKDKLPKGRQVVGSLTAPVCMPDYPRAVSWTLNYSRCVHLRVKDVNGGKYVEIGWEHKLRKAFLKNMLNLSVTWAQSQHRSNRLCRQRAFISFDIQEHVILNVTFCSVSQS